MTTVVMSPEADLQHLAVKKHTPANNVPGWEGAR